VNTLSGNLATKENILSFTGILSRLGDTISVIPGSNGEVLTMSGTDIVWQAPTPSGWSLSGNTGTNPATQFIGTTDNQDLVFKRNNIESFRLSGASSTLTSTNDISVNGIRIGRGSGNILTNTAVGS
jgi:hypothetical protein